MTKTKRKSKAQSKKMFLKLVVIALALVIVFISMLSLLGPSVGNVFSNVMYTFEVTVVTP